MSKKIILRFTLKELSGLIQDEKSRVILQRCIRKIPLQPYCLNDLRAAIHEELDANLAKFDHDLKGLLLSYKNVKIVKNVANMLHDDSRLYVTIQADFYLFMPEVGRVLRGVVNKKSADHIGCLVHKAFNVSIPRPLCETNGEWKGYYVEIGQEVTFRVESLDLTGSLPYMVGCLVDLGSVHSPMSEKLSEEKVSDNLLDAESSEKLNVFQEPPNDMETSLTIGERKKKKKHKKNRELDSTTDLSFTVCENINNNLGRKENYHKNEIYKDVDSNVVKARKKKKKHDEQHETIKQEEPIYNTSEEDQCINGSNTYAEQEDYEEKFNDSKNHIDFSLHATSQAIVSTGGTDKKKKKRKYTEVFQDECDYKEPISKSQDESWTSSKPKKKRKKLIAEMSCTYEDEYGIDTKPKITECDSENNNVSKLVEQLCTEGEYQNVDTPQNLSQEKKKKKKEKLVKEMEYSEPDGQALEEFTERKKKNKKNKQLAEVPSVELKHHNIDTSQEVTQEKTKNKKKKKSFEGQGTKPLFGVTDDLVYNVAHSELSVSKSDRNNQDVNITSQKIKNETILDTDSNKKLIKKNKAQRVSDMVTSTPVECTNMKLSKTDTRLVYTSDMTELQLSPVNNTILMHGREIVNNSQSIKVKHVHKGNNISYFETTHSCSTPLSSLQKGESKHKKQHPSEQSSQHHMKNDFRTLKSNPKLPSRDCNTAVLNKSDITKTNPVQGNSHLCAGSNTSEESSSDSDNRLKNDYTQHRTLKELSRLPVSVSDAKKYKPQNEMNTKETNCSPIRNSSEKSVIQNENTYTRTPQNSDRACSSDSGLSLSVTSGDREFSSSTVGGQKREVGSPSIKNSIVDSPKDEKPVKTSKTPKRKRNSNSDGLHSPKKKKKKEKENSASLPSSSQQSNAAELQEGDDSLEAERMKLLAAMVKRLDGEIKEESSTKHEHNTQLEKEENLLAKERYSSPVSKNKHRKKRNSVDSRGKSNEIVEELGSPEICQKDSSVPITNIGIQSLPKIQASVMAAEEKNNMNSEEGKSPVRLDTKVSVRTPKNKKHPGVENTKVKSTLKKEPKIKVEKESGDENKSLVTLKKDDVKPLEEETPDAIADRLLQEFIKRRSIC